MDDSSTRRLGKRSRDLHEERTDVVPRAGRPEPPDDGSGADTTVPFQVTRERFEPNAHVDWEYARPVATGDRPERARDSRRTTDRLARLVRFIFTVLETLIAIRFVLRLLGANPRSGFASLIYDVTGPLVRPFFGLFGREPTFARSVLEFSSLAAIVVYALLAYALVRLLYVFSD
jgi:uncharacterized protein YggT (Ycf19 family)